MKPLKAFRLKAAKFKPGATRGIYEAHVGRVPKNAEGVFIVGHGCVFNPNLEILEDYERELNKCPESYDKHTKHAQAWAFAKCERRYTEQIRANKSAMKELNRLIELSKETPVFFASRAWRRPDYRYVLLDIAFELTTTTQTTFTE